MDYRRAGQPARVGQEGAFEMVEQAEPMEQVGRPDARQRMLDAAADLHRAHAADAAISTSRLLNPLLDIWSVASELGPSVAAPVEELLTVYAGPRDLASPSELEELVERLRRASEPAMV